MTRKEEEQHIVIPRASNAAEALKAEVEPDIRYHLWNGQNEILFRIVGAQSYLALNRHYPRCQGLFDVSTIDFVDSDLEIAAKGHDLPHFPQFLTGKGLKRFSRIKPLTETLSVGHIGPIAHCLFETQTGLALSPLSKKIKVCGERIKFIDLYGEAIIYLPVDVSQIMELIRKRSIYEANKEEFAKTRMTLPQR